MTNILSENFERVLPKITDRNRHYWQGGATGRLHLLRCGDCGYYLHPPQPVCPRCWSTTVQPEAVSGRGRVYSFTVNHYRWVPGFDPPYLVASIKLEEQSGLRVMSNVVECSLDALRCDLAVEVCFAQHGEIYIPLFRPVTA